MKNLCAMYTIKILKQLLNQGSVLQKVHRVNEFNQKVWSKNYIDVNPDCKYTKK